MLVTKVIGDCPGCGAKNSYGNVAVHHYILRGCKHCDYESKVWLPEIRKNVIYLDQFFFSGALRGNDLRFSTAAQLVKRMCQLQLLVAPYSSVHEDEALEWRGHLGMTGEHLFDFIRTTARGVEFKKAYVVERTQILKAWTAFLAGHVPNHMVAEEDGISGPLNEWEDYYRIEVGGFRRDAELRRRLKTESVDELMGTLDNWRLSTATFDEAIALEISDSGNLYLSSFIAMHNRRVNGDFSPGTMRASVVEDMLQWLPKDQSLEKRLRRCTDFFRSNHFSSVPHEWLSAHMFGTLKEMVRNGAFSKPEDARKRLRGVFEDIRHISLYAPYCDAIVVDKFMADLVGRPTIALAKRYDLKVFSLSSWGALLDWLSILETNMSEEHSVALSHAYPVSAHGDAGGALD